MLNLLFILAWIAATAGTVYHTKSVTPLLLSFLAVVVGAGFGFLLGQLSPLIAIGIAASQGVQS